jgi:hypothetical protein
MISARIKGETLVMEAERSLSKYKGAVEPKYMDSVSAALVIVKEALQGENSPELKSAVGTLDRALLELGRAIYSSGGRTNDRTEDSVPSG